MTHAARRPTKSGRGTPRPTCLRTGFGECSLGTVLVAENDRGVCAVLLGDSRDELLLDLGTRFPGAEATEDAAVEQGALARVMAFVEDPSSPLDLALDLSGTDFQQRVWTVLRDIPVGTTASYLQIAEKVGAPSATRAVAGACAANAVALAIPCHRVVRSDGGLSGYRWGVDRKRELLRREAAAHQRSSSAPSSASCV